MNAQSKIVFYKESKSPKFDYFFKDQDFLAQGDLVRILDLATLEREIQSDFVQMVVLILDQGPSDELVQVISKSRSTSHLRQTKLVSIHRLQSQLGVQKSLMLGVRYLFQEPVRSEIVKTALLRLLQELPNYSAGGVAIHRVANMPFQAEVFGRIGKLWMSSFGDIQIETEANLPEGTQVELRSKFATDYGRYSFTYRVVDQSPFDTYYQYSHNYRLTLAESPESKEKIQGYLMNWMKGNRDSIALPKKKLLWISPNPLGQLEGVFDKTLFSVYSCLPGKLSQNYLDRINPKIILCEALPIQVESLVENWVRAQSNRLLLISTASPSNPLWKKLNPMDLKQFKSEFTHLVKPLLTESMQHELAKAKYLNRKSNFSRCAVLGSGHIIGISRSHLRVELDIKIELGTIFLGICEQLGQGKSGGEDLFHLKAIFKEESGANRQKFIHQYICEILPVSEKAHPEIERLVQLFEQKQASEKQVEDLQGPEDPHEKVVISPRHKETLYFLERRRWWRSRSFLGTVAALILSLVWIVWSAKSPTGIIHGYISEDQKVDKTPTTMDELLKGLRNAFN